MNLSRSTYYYQVRNKKKALEREKQDADLKDLIDDIHTGMSLKNGQLLSIGQKVFMFIFKFWR